MDMDVLKNGMKYGLSVGKLCMRFVQCACMLLFLLLTYGCIKEDDVEMEEIVMVGDKLPDFEIVMSDSTIVTAVALRKSVSVVMFFHTSCPDCRQVLPIVQRLYDEYATKGVVFALISREEEATSIADFWEMNGLTLPYSPQKDRWIYELFAYRRVPRIYVSDSEGYVKSIFTDDPMPTYEAMNEALQHVVGM